MKTACRQRAAARLNRSHGAQRARSALARYCALIYVFARAHRWRYRGWSARVNSLGALFRRISLSARARARCTICFIGISWYARCAHFMHAVFAGSRIFINTPRRARALSSGERDVSLCSLPQWRARIIIKHHCAFIMYCFQNLRHESGSSSRTVSSKMRRHNIIIYARRIAYASFAVARARKVFAHRLRISLGRNILCCHPSIRFGIRSLCCFRAQARWRGVYSRHP